jgi:two-component system alkaline phosphatase synthesis response regulator PhoP
LDAGYEVISVDNGMKCFGLLDADDIPDLILLDVMIPGMDGIDVFKKLRENPLWRNIPTVFLVDDNDGFNEFFINYVLDRDYIVKPFDLNVFAAWIEKRFSKVKSSREGKKQRVAV